MSLENENKKLREALDEANKLAATLALLLQEAYDELGVDSGKEVGKSDKKWFDSFYIDCSREQYPEVKAILEGMGYRLMFEEWEEGNDCVAAMSDGTYMTYDLKEVVGNTFLEAPIYSLFKLRKKYGLTT